MNTFNGNKQIHTFIRGMNMDLDVTLMQEGMYSHAQNIRLTPDGTATGGIVNAIGGFYKLSSGNMEYTYYSEGKLLKTSLNDSDTIVGISKIRDLGVIFVKDSDEMVSIFRLSIKNNTEYKLHRVCKLNIEINTVNDAGLSIVTYWEDEKNIKVYWADGENRLRFVNIAEYEDLQNSTLNAKNVDNLVTSLLEPMRFDELVPGKLLCGAYQYMYQLFNVRGAETELSPATSMIHISDTAEYAKIYMGNNSKRFSGKTASLSFEVNDPTLTHVRVFRVSYLDSKELPTVQIVGEGLLHYEERSSGEMRARFIDNGSVLSEITFEELIAAKPYVFIPTTIEAKDGIMFAGNIKELAVSDVDVDYDTRAFRFSKGPNPIAFITSDVEDSITIKHTDLKLTQDEFYKVVKPEHDALSPVNTHAGNGYSYTVPDEYGNQYLGGSGVNVEYRMITTRLGHDHLGKTPYGSRDEYINSYKDSVRRFGTSGYKIERDIDEKNNTIGFNYGTPNTANPSYDEYDIKKTYISEFGKYARDYSNPYIDGLLKSYQRDEVYRFGAVLYNKDGVKSRVKWIADIRMPRISDENWRLFDNNERIRNIRAYDSYQVVSYPLGLEFKFKNVPDSIVKIEIVRCERTRSDRSVVAQGLLNSTISVGYEGSLAKFNSQFPFPSFGSTYKRTYKPGDATIKQKYVDSENNDKYNNYELHSSERIYSILSPEVVYSGDKFEDLYRQISSINILTGISSNPINTRRMDLEANGKFFTGVSNANTEGIDGYYPVDYKDGAVIDSCILEASALKNIVSKYYCQFNRYTSAGDPDPRDVVDVDINTNDILVSSSIFSDNIGYENGMDVMFGLFSQPIGSVMYSNWVINRIYQEKQYLWSEFKHGPSARSIILDLPNIGDVPRVNAVGSSTNKELSSYFGNKHMNLHSNYQMDGIDPTASSTFLVNAKVNVVPYGGFGYMARQASTYISTGVLLGCSEGSSASDVVFGGDTYIGLFEAVQRHSQFMKNTPDPNEVPAKNYTGKAGQITVIFPCESSINLDLAHGSLLSKVDGFPKAQQIGKGVTPSNESQDRNLYAYNAAYSSENLSTKYVPKQAYAREDKSLDYRIMYSELKTNDEISDSWLKFKPMNFVDLDTRFGEITNLKLFKNSLMFWQKDAFGELPVNQRALLTSDDMSKLLLGSGDLVGKPLYISTVNGLKSKSFESVTSSPSALYWYDYYRNEMLKFTGSLEVISKTKGVQSYFNGLSGKMPTSAKLAYDKKHDEIVASFKNNLYLDNLVYNEVSDVYQSFYTYDTDWSLSFEDNLYTLFGNNLFGNDMNDSLNLFNHAHPDKSTVSYYLNDNYYQTKTFGNVSFYQESDGGSVEFTFDTENSGSSVSKVLDRREENMLLTIPRGNSEESPSLILPTISQRLKGKYLKTKMEYSPNGATRFKVPYIITSYRYSNI